jgi:two-component system NtrC family sensor kinase
MTQAAILTGASAQGLPLRAVPPLPPTLAIAELAQRIAQPEYAACLSLPVVAQSRPLGSVSRERLAQVFLHRYGRELFGPQPITAIMNHDPLIVEASTPLEQAARAVAARLPVPVTEDFIVVADGVYRGTGAVVDLLGAMQRRLAAQAAQLAAALRQLKSSQAALVHAEKMSSLGQMVAGLAHEINTPLGYVRNNLELLQALFARLRELVTDLELLLSAGAQDRSEAVIDARQRLASALAEFVQTRALEDSAGLLEDTLYGVDQIKTLVVNLRDFSRLDRDLEEELDLNECLEQTLNIARPLLKGKVELIKRYGELPRMRGAASQLNQVFLNLLSNAVQAIEHDRGRILLATQASDGWVEVSVADNGRGIPREHLGRIFEPFFTTKPAGQGTGLGLSICDQIVRAHGGELRVSSLVGVGTRFVVRLPAVPAAAARAAAEVRG